MANVHSDQRSATAALAEAPVLAPGHSYGSITDKISSIVLTKGLSRGWLFGLAVSFMLVQVFLVSVVYLIARGVGIWGINVPVGWGFAIVIFNDELIHTDLAPQVPYQKPSHTYLGIYRGGTPAPRRGRATPERCCRL